MKTLLLTITITVFYANIYAQSTITRGTEPGEIYISSNWYVDNQNEMHTAIWRSTDNGQTLNLQYRSTGSAPNGEMGIGKVLGDATPGTLYNIAGGELWVSFDYGVNWEFRHSFGSSGRFTSGCEEGIIFKCCSDVEGTLWRSSEYGYNFIDIRDDAKYVLEVGNLENELYGFDGISGIEYFLHFSNDSGITFSEIQLDSAVAFYAISGNYPILTRGSISGELYLASWWPDYHYKIFYSSDTGYTWTQQYESDYIDIYYWSVYFTAGREPGSFYVKRIRPTEDTQHMLMYIDYSADSAQTFTTYFHDLVETYSVEEIEELEKIGCYPNPFGITTTFNLPKELMKDNSYIEIFDRNGKLLKRIESNSNRVRWDGTNNQGNKVANGVYFYRIKSANSVSKLNKILFLNQ